MAKFLYIQHAASLGGSCMSLLYTMQGMRELGNTCIIALARPSVELENFYGNAGFEVICWPGLALWDHSTVAPMTLWSPFTWRMLGRILFDLGRTAHSTLELVRFVKPDLVHLNSMPFVLSARALIKAKIPFVWHVREPPPDQGLRTQFIRRIMLRAPQMIFISEFDHQEWVGGKKGVVVSNFVDLNRFHPGVDGQALRQKFGIHPDTKVILYLGGVSEIKGFYVLLSCLHLLKQRGIKVVCLAPGTIIGAAESTLGRVAEVLLPLVGLETPKQKARKRISDLALDEILLCLPFKTDIIAYFSASDVAVFPSTKPHFARPVIESIAMHKPAIGSDIGGVQELLAIHPLGRIIPPSDSNALADAIQEVISTTPQSPGVENEFIKVKARFDRPHGVRLIYDVYSTILNKKNHAT